MNNELKELDRPSGEALPDTDHVFASPAVSQPKAAEDAPAGSKIPGGADSARRDARSVVKAPGGKDAARQKDGG